MKRIDSVDSIRVIAILAVIAIHSSPFKYQARIDENFFHLNLLIDQIARFAVPFFFAISGYFYGIKLQNGKPILATSLKSCKRILLIFFCWSLIYLLPYNLSLMVEHGVMSPIKFAYWTFAKMMDNPSNIIFQGSKIHLWFLISLVTSMSISAIFISKGKIKLLIILAISLYVIGIMSKSYAQTSFGLSLSFDTRNGPFMGLLFFVMGYLLCKCRLKETWLYWGLAILILGIILHCLEIYFLMWFFDTNPKQDYVFATILMGLGISMIALSNHKSLRHKSLAKLSGMTLGVYLSHYLFIDLLTPLDKLIVHPAWEIGYVFLVFLLSVALSALLLKFKPTQFLVT